MKIKKSVSLMLCFLFVSAHVSESVAFSFKKVFREVGRVGTQVAKETERGVNKVGKELGRVDDNIKKYAKNPSDALRMYLDLINPIKAIEETSRGLEKLVDGDLGRFAEKVRVESGRVNSDIDTTIEGASDVLQLALTNPKEGLPRLSACMYTICASELVLHKRAEKIRKDGERQYLKMIQEFNQQESKDLRFIVEQRILELENDLDSVKEQIEIANRVLVISGLLLTRMSDAKNLDENSRKVSFALGSAAVKKIGSELITATLDIYKNPSKIKDVQLKKYQELVDQLTMIALNAEVEFDVLMAALGDVLALDKKHASANFKKAESLYIIVTATLDRLNENLVEIEMNQAEQKLFLENL